MKRLAVVFK